MLLIIYHCRGYRVPIVTRNSSHSRVDLWTCSWVTSSSAAISLTFTRVSSIFERPPRSLFAWSAKSFLFSANILRDSNNDTTTYVALFQFEKKKYQGDLLYILITCSIINLIFFNSYHVRFILMGRDLLFITDHQFDEIYGSHVIVTLHFNGHSARVSGYRVVDQREWCRNSIPHSILQRLKWHSYHGLSSFLQKSAFS